MVLGQDQNAGHRMRSNNSNIGPQETIKAYNSVTAKRKVNQSKVYSVNIPFSKYSSPNKPGSAQGTP